MSIKKIFSNYTFIGIVWFVSAAVTVFRNYFVEGVNNYKIFKGVFWHTIQQVPLYAPYPLEYSDTNHYGIFFSIIIAPFALMPDFIGALLWVLANALFLFIAIKSLPLNQKNLLIILFIVIHEMYGASDMQQFNTAIAALLIMSFVFVEKEQEKWATLFIVIGLLTKLYGIVGLAFFFFAKNKIKFIFWGLLWLIICLALPMLYSSPSYVLQQYEGWWISLSEKNGQNLLATLQNISFLGFLRKTGCYTGSDIWIILPAIGLFLLPYLRLAQYKYTAFRLQFLASVCLFIILFSTGSESSTYVIAYVGIGIWFVLSPNKCKWWKISLLILAILASLSGTDLVPKFIKNSYVIPYALRAVPSFIIWINLMYEMCFLDYAKVNADKIIPYRKNSMQP